MPSFTYRFQPFELRSLSFGRDDMAQVGQVSLDAQRDRIGRGVNVNDLPALPLSRAYQKQKSRAGKPPRRDWTFSGGTLRSMRAHATEGQAVVVFEGGGQKLTSLERWNAAREQMAGLSPADQAKVQAVQEQIFRAKVNGHE